jgi:peptide/nickel transport system substrate-binding protein
MKKFFLFALLILIFSSCGENEKFIAQNNFYTCTTNDAPLLPRNSGTENILRVGVGSGGTFPGLFLATHSEDSFDASFNALVNSAIVSYDENNLITNNGIVSFEYNRAENAIVLQMREEIFWHDGAEFTLDDLVFAYEIIAHENYTGVRFEAANFIPNVRGVSEYRAGAAEKICGLVLSNNARTLHIYYENPLPPSVLYAGGVWLAPVARHYISPVVAEFGHEGIAAHMRSRDELLGFGPFKIETVVPGESVFFVANDDYWQGAPLVDGILVELLPFEMVPAAMRNGDFDIAAYQTANLPEFNLMNPTNYQLYGWPTGATTFLNFRLGGMSAAETDDEGNVIGVPTVFLRDDDHPITNLAIRRALSHAVDRQTVANAIGQGLWIPAPSVLHPYNASEFIDLSLEGFVFDLNFANQILDDAGFTERDADGYRLNLNGEPMTFTYGQHSNPTHDALVPLNIQNWREIGLRVEMFNGDILDWGFFTDIVIGSEVGPIDIFAMGWALSANPAPHGLWSNTALFNMPRYTSPAFEQILYDINSERAWDEAFLAAAYSRWERAFFEEVPAIPFTWNLDLVAVNNRVANFSRVRTDTGANKPGNMTTTTWGSHLIGLTASAPYVND